MTECIFANKFDKIGNKLQSITNDAYISIEGKAKVFSPFSLNGLDTCLINFMCAG